MVLRQKQHVLTDQAGRFIDRHPRFVRSILNAYHVAPAGEVRATPRAVRTLGKVLIGQLVVLLSLFVTVPIIGTIGAILLISLTWPSQPWQDWVLAVVLSMVCLVPTFWVIWRLGKRAAMTLGGIDKEFGDETR